jgi:hypothetical protein
MLLYSVEERRYVGLDFVEHGPALGFEATERIFPVVEQFRTCCSALARID